MNINKEFRHIHLTMFNKQEEVFSGEVDDLPNFMAEEQKADRVELYNDSGTAVALMRYEDLKILLEEKQQN